MRRILSNILIIFGLVLFVIGIYSIWERNSSQKVSFNTPPPVQIGNYVEGTATTEGKPRKIIIPSINKELEIFPSEIINNRWESTKKGVSYLATSPLPGEIGNSIIYGHNYPNLLKDLTKVKVGDEILIVFENGGERKFEVGFTQEVRPDQSTILGPTNDRRLTLYTCSGFLDSKRFVVTSVLK